MRIEEILNGRYTIEPVNCKLEQEIQEAWDGIAKPIGSFGKLERMHCRIGAIQKEKTPDFNHSRLIVCCGDHGIVEEGVSQSGQEVTAICASNIGTGHSTAGVLMHSAGGEILAADVGICGECPVPGTIDRRVADGTRNFLQEPAMTRGEFLEAVQVGIDLAEESQLAGVTLLAVGEMGIGNTTSAAVLAGKFLGLDAEAVTGRGAGLDDAGMNRKLEVVRKALLMETALGDEIRTLDDTERTAWDMESKTSDTAGNASDDVISTFCQFGGLELAAMAGVIIGGAMYHIPVILDGVLSMVSAWVAEKCAHGSKEYILPSHMSREPAAKEFAKALDLEPVIDGDLAAGEGVGAALLIGMLQNVNDVFLRAERFEGYGMEAYERYEEQE